MGLLFSNNTNTLKMYHFLYNSPLLESVILELISMPRLTKHQRNQLIGMLLGGTSVSAVTRHFHISRQTVYDTRDRQNQTGSQNDRPRRLGRRKTSRREDNFIRQSHLRERFRTASQTTNELNNIRNGNPVSKKTVIRRLKEFGIVARRPVQRIRLRRINITNRLLWAENHIRWTRDMWNQHLFSDESRFLLERTDGRRRVYRRVNERFIPQCVSETKAFGGGSVMVWGGITAGRKTTLVTVRGNLTAVRYINDILEPHVLPMIREHNLILMHDNAPAHRAVMTREFLRTNNIPVLTPWPAYSPDLNPIEHLWDVLDRAVRQRQHQPQTLEQLQVALHEEWENIPHETVQNLINSMRNRCQTVLNNRGYHTRY